jgi:NitT/TauT family transport system substrate-binding protein
MITRSRALIAAATAVAAPRLARAQALDKLRVAGVPTDDTTPVYYAIRNGLYQKAGLDVEFVPTTSGTLATEAVVSGVYELGKGSPIAFIAAHLRGLPVVAIGNANVWNPKAPFSLMLCASDAPYKTGADLNNLVLSSAALNDTNTLAMNAWIDKNGGDSKTIKWIEVPNSAGATALIEHRSAATMLQEPQLTAALNTGKIRVLAPAYNAISQRLAIAVYFAQKEWASKHADAIDRWVKVTYAAAAFTNNHHRETEAMMSEITKIPLDVFSKISRNTSATSGDPSYLQPMIDAAAKYKQIERTFPAREAYFSG